MRWSRVPSSMCWLFLVGLGLTALSGCKAKYPNCSGDSDCPGNVDGKEWCVNGQCQQCRPDGRDCPAGKACTSGRCEAIRGYCARATDCPSGVCENNRCVACKDDTGCPAGGRCSAGKCEADSRKLCKSSDDCAETEDCINGRCTPVGKGRYTGKDGDCRLDTVYFGINEFDLSSSNSSVVDKNVECVKKGTRAVTLVGHTDPRGTPDYNLALSDKRAQAVKRRMRDLGVAEQSLFMVPRGEMDSTGTDESSWSQDRRVEVNWRWSMRRLALGALALPAIVGGLLVSGCVTSDEGRRMQEQLDQVIEKSKKTEVGGVELASKVQQQNDELRKLLEEAKRLTTNLADASQKAERLQTDVMAVQGKFDDMQRQLDALQKSFTEYRAQSDTKLEQLVNATTVAKAPPLPDNPEGMFAEGQRKFVAGQWNDARRVLDAFVNRYPNDQRASKAQFLIGDAYFSESKFANAIGAFTKVIDNFPKSEDVEAAMFKNGKAFFSLRYCSEAKTYFQELIRRYPKTTFKSDAAEQVKELTKQAKNKAACQS